MAVKIKPIESKSGIGRLMSLGQIGVGVATANPLLVASGGMGLQAQNTGQKSPLGSALDIYSAGKGISDKMATPPASPPYSGSGAMGRALETRQNSPEAMIDQGLKHLDDPSLDMPYEAREKAYMALLEAKHYGPGGRGLA